MIGEPESTYIRDELQYMCLLTTSCSGQTLRCGFAQDVKKTESEIERDEQEGRKKKESPKKEPNERKNEEIVVKGRK